MPHIEPSDKSMYDYSLTRLSNELENSPVGHLCYVVYVLTVRWMRFHQGATPTFARRAWAAGALHEAEEEFRRLHIVSYEQKKIEENGEAE